ncbi:MAG: bifunctional tetrahydrofolate synthase/dihydrofolate synthase [Oceanospirillales bacterium]|nr:bifunctional tetrahydrofolate synthase/dihydrofolate synthase [Oceanospirillales bacterium]
MSLTAPPQTLDAWLARIEACHPSEIELGLTRLAEVAARLPIDLERSSKIIVAGTNGKGSTVAMLESILRQQGVSVGVYTSPHFLRYNERITLNGMPVDDECLCQAFAVIEQARGETPLTYFEYGTLAALLIFSQAQVDVALLEVGLGGRLDAVNIVDADIAVVTTVALDHTDWLGSDRETIGFEKAGIFRTGKPALCGDVAAPDSVIRHADSLAAPLYRNGVDYRFERGAGSWNWNGLDAQGNACSFNALPLPTLPLSNAALVMQVLQLLPFSVSESAVRQGFARACLAGRMQPVQIGALAATLDVAHNPEAALYLADTLRREQCEGQLHLVLGMLADKDIRAVVEQLVPVVDRWYPVTLDVPRGATADTLVGVLAEAGVDAASIHAADDVADAVAMLQALDARDRVVIAGSFFTVAEALALISGAGN